MVVVHGGAWAIPDSLEVSSVSLFQIINMQPKQCHLESHVGAKLQVTSSV